MSDIYNDMWEILYDCSPELRNTRPTDPKRINREVDEAIRKSFEEKIKSPAFVRLEERLAEATMQYGEGMSQYAISRALSHVKDIANDMDCNGRFIRHADNVLTKVTNRQLERMGATLSSTEIYSKQIENCWKGRLANGLRPPVQINRAFIIGSATVGLGAICRGIHNLSEKQNNIVEPREPESPDNNKATADTMRNAVALTQIVGGTALGKWGLTGKVLPGIHKIRLLR